jgi:hypothetical protein
LTHKDRSFAIQKIFELHALKKYKVETLFSACMILDRYLLAISFEKFPRNEVFSLTIVSLLLAAKLEEAIAPSFLKMISLVPEAEKHKITKDKLVDLEMNVIKTLDFNFQIAGPC